MSIINASYHQVNPAGNAYIAVSNTWNVAIATSGSERVVVSDSSTLIQGSANVTGGANITGAMYVAGAANLATSLGVAGVMTTNSNGLFFGSSNIKSTSISSGGTISDSTGTIRPIVQGTTVASTSGTSIEFANLPSWVTRITFMFNSVSTNGSSVTIIQLGTGAGPTYNTTGYLGSTSDGAAANYGAGFIVQKAVAAADIFNGMATLTNMTGNVWAFSVAGGLSSSAKINSGGGVVPLSAPLTAVRFTTTNGTDTFDLGSVNIMYE